MYRKILVLMMIAGLCSMVRNVYAKGEMSSEDEECFISLTREVQLKEDLPTNVSTINNEEIQKTGARNVGEILDFSTDINVGKYGSLGSINSVILRGALDKQVLLLIDGRPVNDITLGGYDYSKLSVENIERIEIIRGAASSIYGANALAGVINVITKEVCFERPIVDFNVSYGGYGEQIYRLNVAKKIGNLETNFSGSKMLSQGFRKNSAYDNDSLNIYAGLRSDNAGMFKLKGGITRYELGLPGKNHTPLEEWDNNIETTASYPLTKKTGNESYLTLSHEKDLTDKIKLTSRLYGSLDSGRYTSPENEDNDLTERITTGLEIQGNMPYGLIIGGELRQDTAKRTDEFDAPVIIDFDKRVDWTSLYLQENYSPRDNLNTIIGLRYDQHSFFGGEINPQLTVVWKLQENWKLSSNIGKSYRAPSFEDLFSPYSSWIASAWGPAGDSQGNPDVKPESSLSYDVGIEKNWKDNISSQITLFRQNIDNLIEWNNISDIETWEEWRPSNVLNAYNQGVELELKHSINENLFYSFNYTYLESKGKEKTEKNYKTLMYRPSNSANLILSYMTPWKTRVILTGKYVGEQYDDSDNLISPYNLLNIRFEQTFFNYTKIFVSVDNITDTRYFTRAGYPLPGRVARTGITATF